MSRPLVLFDLTRLLSATGRAAPTGIERVEYHYAKWLAAHSGMDVRFVATVGRSVSLVPEGSVAAFLDRQSSTWSQGSDGFSATTAINNVNSFLAGEFAPPAPQLAHLSPEERHQRQRARAADNPSPSVLRSWAQQMAATWAHDPLAPVLRRARGRQPVLYLRASSDKLENPVPFENLKALGAKMAVMTHDTIPLDYPEFVRPKAADLCAARTRTMARLADGIIANSHYSAARLEPLLGPNRPRIAVAHLGVDEPVTNADLPPLVDEPFFLIVSTIEARKNHSLLLKLWRRMVDEMGTATPKLVIAGKRGWEAHMPIAILDRARDLAPYVYEAGAVPDEALHLLRRRARAVLMPSFVEGFGLPVTEALAVDTPVIASDIPVFREIASEACELLDPLDGPAWRKAICDYADARSPRLAAARERARRFEPPTWRGHFDNVQVLVDDLVPSPVTLGQRTRRVLGSAALLGQQGAAKLPRPTDRGRTV